ncbi:MAG: hypothetical protein ACOCUW_02655 [Gemmatimonadota bacterium]
MKRITVLAAVAALFLWTGAAGAQSFVIGAHGGMASPQGDFSSTSGTEAGGGLTGLNVGVDALYSLESVLPKLSWYSSLDFVRNPIAGSLPDRAGAFVDGTYYFVPLMTGIRYDLAPGVPALFFTAQAGLVFARGPERLYPWGFGDMSPKLSTAFGYNVGAGFQMTPNLHAGVKYYPLGTVEMEYENAPDPLEQDVSFLEFHIGVRLFGGG